MGMHIVVGGFVVRFHVDRLEHAGAPPVECEYCLKHDSASTI